MARIGLLIAGSGLLDASDPTQAVLLHVAIARAGDVPVGLAPEGPLRAAVHPRSAALEDGGRDALLDASRLLRADCQPVTAAGSELLDALLVPGGLGAAKSLAATAIDGVEAKMAPGVEELVAALHTAGKPIGALDEGLVVVARALRDRALILADPGEGPLRGDLVALGHELLEAPLTTVVADERNAVFSAHSDRGPNPVSAALAAENLFAKLSARLAAR